MNLFDHFVRDEHRVKSDLESDFDYHNTSARPAVEAYRCMAECWFQAYPDEHKRDLRARFRSRSMSDHHGAFFELYLHQLLRSMACEVEVHPKLPNSSNHPDFLATDSADRKFYVEAVLAHCPSKEEEAVGRRTAVVYDCLNDTDCPDYFLGLHISGAPRSSPPGSRLRQDLEKWLASQNYDDIVLSFKTGQREDVPRFCWSHDGWDLEIEPIPKSPATRGKSGVRPIGARIPEARWMNTASEIRNAVKAKAKKYGRLDQPLLVCVNVLDWCDRIEVFNALIGQEETVITFSDDDRILHQEPGRKKNGVFGWGGEPRNRRVSAVAVARDLSPWTMGKVTPELFHHPWPYISLPTECWPMPQWIANHQESRLQSVQGLPAAEVLKLPDPWPVSME